VLMPVTPGITITTWGEKVKFTESPQKDEEREENEKFLQIENIIRQRAGL